MRVSASTLGELCGLSTRSVAELLVDVGDPRRFTEGGFARFNGSAPLAASTAEGPDGPPSLQPRRQPPRQRSPAPHGRHAAALRTPRKLIYERARARGHTKREARRILKRHLSDVIHRRMMRDLKAANALAMLAA